MSAKIVRSLKTHLNIDTPTPVQEKAIPLVKKGIHIAAQAKTGTGKTLAYVIPIIEKLKFTTNEALVLVPTRELATQVNDVIESLEIEGVKSIPIYGGVSIENQIRKLEQGVQIVVGTPGRIIDLYKRRVLKPTFKFVVIDEADRMFDMGFAPDVKYILSTIKTQPQFMLFSATLDAEIRELINKFTRNQFTFLNISRDDLTVGSTRQFYYIVDMIEEKLDTFLQILKIEKPSSALVFTNTIRGANWLHDKLKARNSQYKLGLLSGDLSQAQRERILNDFKAHKINMLIATDVAARGLDIDNISHVFNYDLPKYPDVYIHRIGRTSRMEKEGVAITLCMKDEYEYLCQIEGLINKEITERTLAREEQRRNRFPFY